jgi:hypothetical protein
MDGLAGSKNEMIDNFEVSDLSELVRMKYSNGISSFQVIAVDNANPKTHVVAEHLKLKYSFSIAASIVSKYITAAKSGPTNENSNPVFESVGSVEVETCGKDPLSFSPA